jgi:ubiquinone/menaquinone biosynthesis C-methylase UbiE
VTPSDPPGGPPPLPADAAARAAEKQESLARVYDADVWPVFASQLARLARDVLPARPAARVVEIGCATGALTLELARLQDAASTLTAVDEAPAFLARARARLDEAAASGTPAAGRVTWLASPPAPLALPDASADLVVSNVAAAAFPDPARAAAELARVLAPGGRVVVTTTLRGSWAEFLDIFRDVLVENGTPASLAALEQYVSSLLDAAGAAAWLEAAGFTDVRVTARRWEILFKTAREFFFAPVVELGPLSRWKRIAGRGEAMQDAFFFTKEAIDTYFRGTAFPITIVGAAVVGTKGGASAA